MDVILEAEEDMPVDLAVVALAILQIAAIQH